VNRPFLWDRWDVNMNASEEKELAWARLSTMFNTSAGTVRMYDMRQILSLKLSKCWGFSGLVNYRAYR